MASASPEAAITRIRPSRGALSLDLAEMWRFRDLLYFLSWRDVKVKYKQALLGFAWAVLVPVANMAVFGVVFGKIAKLPAEGIDPFAFYLAALVPWQYFANSLTFASQSLVGQAGLLTKIYLPRVFLPLSSCVANFVDFAIAFAVMVGMMVCVPSFPAPALTFVLAPLVMILAALTALGAGLGLAALNVKYRDVRYIVPFLVQMWMYASVIVPYSKIREMWGAWAPLYGLNPMASVVEAVRWCLLHSALAEAAQGATPAFPWVLLAVSVPTAFVLLLLGLAYFKRVESLFADIV